MSLYIEGNVVTAQSPETAERAMFTFEELAKLLARLGESVTKYDVVDDPEFQKMSLDERHVVYEYLSSISSYMRAVIYSGMNPHAGEEASSDSYLRTLHAADQRRMWDKVTALTNAIREAFSTQQ